MTKTAFLTVAFFSTVIGACSASPESETGAEAARSGLSEEATPQTTKGCPSTPPSNGAACALIDEVCTYGTDPRFGCRTWSACTANGWSTTVPSCKEPAPKCPHGVFPIDAGANVPCSARDEGLTCVSGQTTYTCATNNGDIYIIENGQPLRKWWPTHLSSTECPRTAPNTGAACSVEGASCNYGACMNTPSKSTVYGTWVSCTDGIWQYVNHGCI